MASNKTNVNKFDHLPIIVQLIIGLGLLLVVAAAGFGCMFLLDIVILDFDPVGKLVASIAGLFS